MVCLVVVILCHGQLACPCLPCHATGSLPARVFHVVPRAARLPVFSVPCHGQLACPCVLSLSCRPAPLTHDQISRHNVKYQRHHQQHQRHLQQRRRVKARRRLGELVGQ